MIGRGTRTVEEVAEGIGISTSQLYRWHGLYADKVRGDAVPDSSQEVEALRRRLRQVEQENALLKKAAAFFAKESL